MADHVLVEVRRRPGQTTTEIAARLGLPYWRAREAARFLAGSGLIRETREGFLASYRLYPAEQFEQAPVDRLGLEAP